MWKPQRRRDSGSGSDGWTAFDLKHRQKQGSVPPNHNSCDPFPPVAPPPHHLLPKPTSLTPRPFSSLLPQTQTQTHSDSSSATATGSLNNDPKHHLHHTFTRHVDMDMDMDMEAVHDIHDATADSSPVSGHSKISSLPVESEWDGDRHQDLYLTLRKDAFTTIRSASQHSKAATNAFIRGDHFSAKQHSLKAKQQWVAAQKLNAEAAKEILKIRNCKNDIWELDLHGLHAAEAIQVLKEHLQKIENQVYYSNRSLSPATVRTEGSIGRSSSLQSFTCIDVEKLNTQQASSRQRPTSLHVITGVGNHSRGQAALPKAVRGFLNENGYRFEEFRPGVIAVRPKYRNTNRGDHFSAKQHSLKAQQQWGGAHKLNTEAAKEILNVRNCENDIWKLDLHRLHAAKAIQVLKEHLQKIENQEYYSNCSLTPATVRTEGRIGHSSSLQSFTCIDVEKLNTQQASSRQRPTSLHVITGVGNHSPVQAALPTAVRGFLNENGYRFEEFRPGVIAVRPKYCNTNRGDHFSAKEHSLKAQQQWVAAQKLNTEAAKEILNVRNCKNDIWKLDVHRLHAAKAIQVLKEHLQKIENQVYYSNRPLTPATVRKEGRIGCSSSLQSFTCIDVEKLNTQQASSWQRPTSLHVITGAGNHSQGQAALPTAVRGFLNENGYCFEEFRPGVIAVRPKYCNTNR